VNKNLLDDFNDYLQSYIENINSPADKLKEAILYSLFSNSKRARPQFVFLTAEMLGLDCKRLFPAAAAIELIHTYSLIHDDLPAMDNDDFRRGKPSCHKAFGEDMAILAGDAMFSLAYQVLIDGARKNSYSDKIIVRMFDKLNIATGLSGMVAGQVLDIEEQSTTIDDLIKMHSLKTGALIQTAILLPAVLAEADQDKFNSLINYAYHIGIAFQIKDDLLDFEGTLKSMGKTPKKDETKKTFVTILGIPKATIFLKEETAKAIESLQIFSKKSTLLLDYSKYLLERTK